MRLQGCLDALAVGIGASTAVFTVISIVLRPLPVAEPDRLARLHLGDPQEDAWAYRVWEEIDRRSEDVFAGGVRVNPHTVRDRRVGREPVRRGPLGQRPPRVVVSRGDAPRRRASAAA